MMSAISSDFDSYVIRLTSSISKLQDTRLMNEKFQDTFQSLLNWLEEVDGKIAEFSPASTRNDAEMLLQGYQVRIQERGGGSVSFAPG